jgi:hypothetical protein
MKEFAMHEHYEAVLADLRARKSACLASLDHTTAEIDRLTKVRLAESETLKQLETTESTILDLLRAANPGNNPSDLQANPQNHRPEIREQSPRVASTRSYRGISVRWAILWMLFEASPVPMTRNRIAEALQRGGISTAGKDFLSNVSAILSQMSSKGEVSQVSGEGWFITERGRSCWELIRQTEKFKQQTEAA